MEVVWRECTTSWVLLFPMFQVKMTHFASFFWWCLTKKIAERFEPRSHLKSRLSLIVRVNVFLNRTVFVEKGGSPKYFICVWGICKNANSHSQNQGFENFNVLKVFTSYYNLSQDVDTFYLFLNWFSTRVYTRKSGASIPEKLHHCRRKKKVIYMSRHFNHRRK